MRIYRHWSNLNWRYCWYILHGTAVLFDFLGQPVLHGIGARMLLCLYKACTALQARGSLVVCLYTQTSDESTCAALHAQSVQEFCNLRLSLADIVCYHTCMRCPHVMGVVALCLCPVAWSRCKNAHVLVCFTAFLLESQLTDCMFIEQLHKIKSQPDNEGQMHQFWKDWLTGVRPVRLGQAKCKSVLPV
jgi:hypothetical protein